MFVVFQNPGDSNKYFLFHFCGPTKEKEQFHKVILKETTPICKDCSKELSNDDPEVLKLWKKENEKFTLTESP